MQVMYDKRSKLGLVGSSFDTSRSDWSSRETTIGPGIDSYYEYLLKVPDRMQIRPTHVPIRGRSDAPPPHSKLIATRLPHPLALTLPFNNHSEVLVSHLHRPT